MKVWVKFNAGFQLCPPDFNFAPPPPPPISRSWRRLWYATKFDHVFEGCFSFTYIKSIIFYQKRSQSTVFLQRTCKISSALGLARRLQLLIGARNSETIKWYRPRKQPPNCKFLAARLFRTGEVGQIH